MSQQNAIHDEAFFNELRRTEYANLDGLNQTYLDYTGSNLCSRSLLLKHQSFLLDHILGNPHSTNPTSQTATQYVESARARILEFFHAEDYTCVFTQNASAALKIVGESYPFDENSRLLMLSDNHNSVNGIREYCRQKKGKTQYVPLNYEDLQVNEQSLIEYFNEPSEGGSKLFAFPAQSNVSGVKHDLKWIEYAHQRNYDVLLDAAAFVPSSRLDLSVYKPDFVCMSFYKIFGYPTGIGCLLIRNQSYHKLNKPWFAGGTVTLVSVAAQNKFLAKGHERFEDGTLNFNNIPAVEIGLDYIDSIGIERINARIKSLIQYLVDELKKLHHDNGKPIVKIFGPEGFERRGGNIIMNFFDTNEQAFPFQSVEQLANEQFISLRTGCFCNPGIDEINNCITNEEMSKYFMTHDQGDYYDMVHYLGKMRGATRVSVGIATIKSDLDRFIGLIAGLKNKTRSELTAFA